MRLTRAQIMAARTDRGGWTKATLAGWGIPWPPPKGWIEHLVDSPVATVPHAELAALREVHRAALLSLPVLISMLKAARLGKGAQVASDMLEQAKAIPSK